MPDSGEGQVVLFRARAQQTQDDHVDALIPCGKCPFVPVLKPQVTQFSFIQESYSPDDNSTHAPKVCDITDANAVFIGFDLRPFLYPSRFPWQFKKIDQVAAALPDRSNLGPDKAKTD